MLYCSIENDVQETFLETVPELLSVLRVAGGWRLLLLPLVALEEDDFFLSDGARGDTVRHHTNSVLV